MPRLTLRHLADQDEVRFAVLGEPGGERREALIPAAHRHPVPGRPDSFLVSELRWYLERFLEYPFPPATGRAEQVLAALRGWGEEAFAALFGQEPEASRFAAGLHAFRLRIESDDPRILAWPWEALGSRETGPLGTSIRMERSLATLSPPVAPSGLPGDRLEVLLIIARGGDSDVAYRSVARPIVELTAELPIRVHVLRPPTIDALRDHLRKRPNTYHVLHFDGHGDVARFAGGRAEGRLVFEGAAGDPHPVLGRAMAEILREHPVPLVILNACRSAQFDPRMRDPFAAVAAALLAAGTGSVVAMASELSVLGARELLPTFYRTLCATGDPGAAVLAGRRRMAEQPERLSSRGRFPLQDWLVPVLYQREGAEPAIPPPLREIDHGGALALRELERSFVGRDGVILLAERFLRQPPYAVRIHGLAGVGKTAFARAFAHWLLATQGVDEIHWLAGGDLEPVEVTLQRFAGCPGEKRRLFVLDQIDELAPGDREALAGRVRRLRGEGTRIVVTSRGNQDEWGDEVPVLPLAGLTGEEAWELFEQITAGHPSPIERSHPRLGLWMDLIGGHPRALRALGPQLARCDAATLLDDLRSGAFAARAVAEEGGPSSDLVALLAPLRCLEGDPGEPLASLRIPIAFHEGFLQADLLEEMWRRRGGPRPRSEIDALLQTLVVAGLLTERGAGFTIHPALPGFLRARVLPLVEPEARDAWARAFTSVMGSLAYELEPRPFHRQDRASALNRANFVSALEWARRLAATTDEMALLQWMATYSQQYRQFDEAIALLLRLIELHRTAEEEANVAALFHRLGMVVQEQGDLGRAEVFYLISLRIDEELADAAGAARTSHQLGMLAQEKQDFAGAEEWFRRALEGFERHQLNRDAMATCYQLGVLAEGRGKLDEAAAWYERGRMLASGSDDEHVLARFEKELSTIALLRGDLQEARRQGQQSLIRKLRLRDQRALASGYQQLGLIAQEEGDLDAAEKCFHRSLRFSEEMGQRLATANSYHHLGAISQMRDDPGEARKWFRRALELAQGPDDVETATTHHHLGMVAQELGELDEAEREYKQALLLIERKGNDREAVPSLFQLGLLAAEQGRPDEAEQWLRASLQVAQKAGDDIGAARAWYYLGEHAAARRDLAAAESAYRESLHLSEKLGLGNFSAASLAGLAFLAFERETDQEALAFLVEAIGRLAPLADIDRAKKLREWLVGYYRLADGEDRDRIRSLVENAGLGNWLRLQGGS